MHSSGRIASKHLRQTLVPNRCSEDRVRRMHGHQQESDLTLLPPNAAPISAPLVPTLTCKRALSDTFRTSVALSNSTHIDDSAVTAFRPNPLAQVPHVSGPEAAAQPLWNGIIPRDRLL